MSVSANPIATGWLNENSLREYPFHEGCGLRPNDSSGTLVDNGWSLPNCLLVDISISISGSDFDPYLYLGKMSVVEGSVTLAFCDRNGDRVISLYATKESHSKNDSYQVSGTGSFSDARGVVCLGDLEEFFGKTPEGSYSFSPEETMIEPCCIRPSSIGVRRIIAVDSSGYSSVGFSGDVRLVAGENIRFDYDNSENALIISADPNSGYSDTCDCESSENNVVRSINGISVYDVNIVGDDCVNVTSDNGIVRISDECSKPCCGCAETSFINQTINDLQTSVNALAGNVSLLGDRLSAFVTSYVLSRKTLK
jgi:hypothetical protein